MPEYNEKELPERNFLFIIVSKLYQLEFGKYIEEAYEHRFTHHKQKRDELIELTPIISEFSNK